MSDSLLRPQPHTCTLAPGDASCRMAAAHGELDTLRGLTLNHRSVGLQALADAAVDGEHGRALHEQLGAAGIESMVLTTCNRTEVYWRSRLPDDDNAAIRAFTEAIGPAAVPQWLQGSGVAQHLFRVCCGLESLVLGEAEILGQVRKALDACAHAGPFLTGVVQAALRTGRVARTETNIGTGAMSVASAAVKLLASRLPLHRSRVLVVGAGATGAKVARHLRAVGVQHLVMANRTLHRARACADGNGATAVPLENLDDELVVADAVIGAAAAPGLLITAEQLAEASAARDGRELVVLDLGMPPVVASTPQAGITRMDLQTIEQHVAEQRERRAGEIPRVLAVIAHELEFLRVWARQHAMRPLIADLRRKAEDIRQTEVARAQEQFGREDREILDLLSRRLLDQLLALPVTSLERGHVPLGPMQTTYLRRLFGLDPEGSL